MVFEEIASGEISFEEDEQLGLAATIKREEEMWETTKSEEKQRS